MTKPVLIIGAGGHGRVVADLVRARGGVVAGFLETNRSLHGQTLLGCEILDEDALERFEMNAVCLANGIGTARSVEARALAYERFRARGHAFEPLVHPSAVVALSAEIAPGAQVMAGAIVQAGARIGENAIVNTGAIVDHDCDIGAHCHIAPGAVLCGNVGIGARAFIGAGSTIIQGMAIGAGATVAAGALVTAPVSEGSLVIGIPARPMGSK